MRVFFCICEGFVLSICLRFVRWSLSLGFNRLYLGDEGLCYLNGLSY